VLKRILCLLRPDFGIADVHLRQAG